MRRLLPRAAPLALLGALMLCAAAAPTQAVGAAPSAVQFSAASYRATATSGVAAITIQLSAPAPGTVVVSYATADGSAVAGVDYASTSGTLAWAAGDAAPKSFTVPIATGDPGNRSFDVVLLSASGAIFGAPIAARVTILASAPPAPAAAAPTVAFAAASFMAYASAGSALVTVDRGGSVAAPVTISYATANGSALAGTDYAAAVGTLAWAAGDAAPKSFSIPILSPAAAGKSLSVVLLSASGATFGAPIAASVDIEAPAPGLSIQVRGNVFIDGSGGPLQLRGASISGLENTAIQGWAVTPTGYNDWGDSGLGTEPDFALLAAWGMNVVRLPLNEASWLGYTCTNLDGSSSNPDPAGVYRSTVASSVRDANAAGLYVILDLHWSAPGTLCPRGQTQMADADNALTFWSSVAAAFRGNPAVIFELYNEPFGQNLYPVAASDWSVLLAGGAYASFVYQDSTGAIDSAAIDWQAAGMQAMLSAVRAAGADNVVLVGTMGWNGDLSQWLNFRPVDPAGQMAAAWHAYPWNSNPALPAWSGIGDQYAFAAAIEQQVPLVITETAGLTLLQTLLPWADQTGHTSYLEWSWNPWGASESLIADDLGTPTAAGLAYRAHLACVASGASGCP